MEPLPEHLYEEITAEQLVIDIAALTDLTEDEVRHWACLIDCSECNCAE